VGLRNLGAHWYRLFMCVVIFPVDYQTSGHIVDDVRGVFIPSSALLMVCCYFQTLNEIMVKLMCSTFCNGRLTILVIFR
jgi:hypothetical protein